MDLKGLVLILPAVLLAGCVTDQAPKKTASLSKLVEQQTQDVDREVEDAGLYSGVLEPLAVAKVTIKNPDYATDEELFRVVNSSFNGKIEDFVSLIARKTGYRVIADGEKPGAPIFITLVLQDLPAVGAMREAFHQAKGSARLIIDQTSKTMTIHYLRRERSPVPHLEDREV